MEGLVVVLLMLFLGYLIYDETLGDVSVQTPRKRLCDYFVAGSAYESVSVALARGVRLLELHIYSDERDEPVVGMKPQAEGVDYAEENVSFESVCVDIANDSSDEPLIVSLVPHTTKTLTINKVAEHILTTFRRRLVTTDKPITTLPLDALKGKVVLVSGSVRGTELEPLVNLSWDGSSLRRLSYQQALHPRDPEDLIRFNRDHITLVAPEAGFKTTGAHPDRPKALGCQWNLFDTEGRGFVEKTLAR
jgi:hypothetical protein